MKVELMKWTFMRTATSAFTSLDLQRNKQWVAALSLQSSAQQLNLQFDIIKEQR